MNTRPVTPSGSGLQSFFNAQVTGETYDAVNDQSSWALFTHTGTGSVTSFVFSAIGAFSFSQGDVFGIYSPYTGMLVPIFDLSLVTSAAVPLATVTFMDGDLDGVVDDVAVAKNDPFNLGSGVITGGYLNFGPSTFGYYTRVGYNDPGSGDYTPGSTLETHHTEDDANPGDSAWALMFNGHGGTISMPGSLLDVTFDSNHWVAAFEVFSNPGPKDFDDLIVVAESVAPVPEPASLALLCVGFAGLAVLWRRRKT